MPPPKAAQRLGRKTAGPTSLADERRRPVLRPDGCCRKGFRCYQVSMSPAQELNTLSAMSCPQPAARSFANRLAPKVWIGMCLSERQDQRPQPRVRSQSRKHGYPMGHSPAPGLTATTGRMASPHRSNGYRRSSQDPGETGSRSPLERTAGQGLRFGREMANGGHRPALRHWSEVSRWVPCAGRAQGSSFQAQHLPEMSKPFPRLQYQALRCPVRCQRARRLDECRVAPRHRSAHRLQGETGFRFARQAQCDAAARQLASFRDMRFRPAPIAHLFA